jgi:hypothetical protein
MQFAEDLFHGNRTSKKTSSAASKILTSALNLTLVILFVLKSQLFCHQTKTKYIQPIIKIDVVII